MRKARKVRWWRIVFGLMGMAILGFPVLAVLSFARMASYDCNEHPPAETFARYFGTPPPGVRDIRTTGHISLGGADVWMRFQATPAAIDTLTGDYQKLKGDDVKWGLDTLLDRKPFSPYHDPNKQLPPDHQVRWEELSRVSKPVVYTNSRDGGVDNLLAFDPQRGLAYFYHWNQ